ncbi:condensation domain-containing protein, partial [Pseudomonas syringae group genomosp. 7]|uniref:condensation domain-containing protein n=1 Tax=Pseudomonas syringae group genomosp. 7 TaxID=251699 RepID=UPI00377064CA
HWLFDTPNPDRQHWNQSLVLEQLSTHDPRLLDQALRALLEQHDALRQSFTEHNGQMHSEHPAVTAESQLIQARVAD